MCGKCGICNVWESMISIDFFKHCVINKKDIKGKKGHKNMSDQDEKYLITKSKKEQ